MITETQVTLGQERTRRSGTHDGGRRGFVSMSKFFRIDNEQSVNVLELNLPDQIDTAEFDTLNESLLDLVQKKSASSAGEGASWVIDLARVSYMGSAMLGMIVNLRQQIRSIGGELVLCGLSPRLLGIFRTCCMERLFTIVRTRADAMKMAV